MPIPRAISDTPDDEEDNEDEDESNSVSSSNESMSQLTVDDFVPQSGTSFTAVIPGRSAKFTDSHMIVVSTNKLSEQQQRHSNQVGGSPRRSKAQRLTAHHDISDCDSVDDREEEEEVKPEPTRRRIRTNVIGNGSSSADCDEEADVINAKITPGRKIPGFLITELPIREIQISTLAGQPFKANIETLRGYFASKFFTTCFDA
jgi:hypothetical protein